MKTSPLPVGPLWRCRGSRLLPEGTFVWAEVLGHMKALGIRPCWPFARTQRNVLAGIRQGTTWITTDRRATALHQALGYGG